MVPAPRASVNTPRCPVPGTGDDLRRYRRLPPAKRATIYGGAATIHGRAGGRALIGWPCAHRVAGPRSWGILSPASIATLSRFSAGGSGQVAKSV